MENAGFEQSVLDLNSQQAMFASIVRFSEDAIISKTLKGIVTSWNQAAERLFGYKPDEILGKHISLLIPKDMIAVPFGSPVRFICVASPDYLDRFGEPKTPEDLARHHCIG
ncbi:MAG: PAS domain S-box protein, partial [Agriterribacter sp.]